MKITFKIKPRKGIIKRSVETEDFELTDEFINFLRTLKNKDRKITLIHDKAFEWFLENFDFYLRIPEELLD